MTAPAPHGAVGAASAYLRIAAAVGELEASPARPAALTALLHRLEASPRRGVRLLGVGLADTLGLQ